MTTLTLSEGHLMLELMDSPPWAGCRVLQHRTFTLTGNILPLVSEPLGRDLQSLRWSSRSRGETHEVLNNPSEHLIDSVRSKTLVQESGGGVWDVYPGSCPAVFWLKYWTRRFKNPSVSGCDLTQVRGGMEDSDFTVRYKRNQQGGRSRKPLESPWESLPVFSYRQVEKLKMICQS